MSVRPEDFEVNFHEYAERKDAYILIEKCALIVAESDIDLDVFIENFVRERGLSEDWSNFWSGVKDTAAWAWEKTKNFGPVKAGADRLNRAFDDKYMKAYNSLKTLHDFLSKVEGGDNVFSQNDGSKKVADWVGTMLGQLGKEKQGVQSLLYGVSNPQTQQDVTANTTNKAGAGQQNVGAGVAPSDKVYPPQNQKSRTYRPNHGGYAGSQKAPVFSNFLREIR